VAPPRRLAEDSRAVDPRRPILEDDASLERRQCVRAEASGDEDVVDAAHPVTGMRQPERERPVVREEQEPLGIVVEPSDGMEAHSELRDQIEHPWPAARVLSSGEVSARLVEEDIALGLSLRQPAPVDLDAVLLGVGVRSELDHWHTVDVDPSLDDEPFGSPARRDASLGQELVEPDRRHGRQAGDELPRSSSKRSASAASAAMASTGWCPATASGSAAAAMA